jgi:hypothetical protein
MFWMSSSSLPLQTVKYRLIDEKLTINLRTSSEDDNLKRVPIIRTDTFYRYK